MKLIMHNLCITVTSLFVKHLALCARFLYAENNIRRKLLTFVQLERTTGGYEADQVMKCLHSIELPLVHLRGQSYDGAKQHVFRTCWAAGPTFTVAVIS